MGARTYQGQQKGGGQEVACHFHLSVCPSSKALQGVRVSVNFSTRLSVKKSEREKDGNLSDNEDVKGNSVCST